MSEKRKPTKEEWEQIRILYLKGMKPSKIVEQFPELNVTAKYIGSKFSANQTRWRRDQIKKRVEERLIQSIEEEQFKANEELIKVSTRIVDIIKKYLDTEQYKDFAGFNYGKMVKTRADTVNTFAFNQVVKALAEAQKVQRLALGMDEKLQAEKLPEPIINIDFGDNDECD